MPLPQVLCVDDDPDVLRGLRLSLRRHARVMTAESGGEGLALLRDRGPFAVVLSDMQMPSMLGTAFLARARAIAPDTVRMVLTGCADQSAAIEAINEGHVFRFLTKPCSPPQLVRAIEAALEQHRLLTSERVLLEETLRGAIRVLTQLLSLSQPAAFGRSTRVLAHVRRLADRIGLAVGWQLEVAVRLSDLGCVTLPADTVERIYRGEALGSDEAEMAARVPEVTDALLNGIPRLEQVRAILDCARLCFERMSDAPDAPVGEEIPIEARLLRLASDYEQLEARDEPQAKRLAELRGRSGWYDPALLAALEELIESGGSVGSAKQVEVRALRPGMILMDDVQTESGTLLISRGHPVSPGLILRLHNLRRVGGPTALRVIVPND